MAYNGFWADFQMDAHYSVWADPHAVLYGGVFLLFLALVLLVVSLPFLRARNNLSGRQPQGKKPRRIPELERGVGFRVLSSLAAKYDGSFRHTCENDTYTVTLSLRAG